MTFLDWFNLGRIAAAMGLLYFAIPIVARRLGDRARDPWYLDIAPSFVYASAFLSISATILGNWRLCYAGLMGVLVVIWAAGTVAFASNRRWIWDADAWGRGFLSALRWFEVRAWRQLAERIRSGSSLFEATRTAVLFAALLGIAFVSRAGFAVENCRFLGAQTYERALSMQSLVNGSLWVRDGSVALLAAVAQFSGADGATAIRFTGPLFSLLLVAAGGYCAWVYTRQLASAYLACVLLAIYPAVLGFDSPGEPAGPEIAAVYWVLALALARSERVSAIAAGVTALSVHAEFTPVLAGTLLCVSAAVLFSVALRRAPAFLRTPAGAIGIGIAAVLLLSPAQSPAAAGASAPLGQATIDGPFQYESAARTANRIARQFPRNKWMIVSPAQELSTAYGRGWHLQISDFVRLHTPQEAADPAFRFNFTVDDLFVFVEKEPLRQWARGPGMAADEYSFVYLTQIGRTALEFQAHQIMAAYASTHKDAEIYAEDDHLVVYRVKPEPQVRSRVIR